MVDAHSFEQRLSIEAARVLDDLLFRRSPVQSRLLAFLVERTLGKGKPPTQFEVAVDGLGKHDDYDIENDSYPRVQISRLRKNLENYYSRNLPNDGFAIALEKAHYRLQLVPIEKAVTVKNGSKQDAPLTKLVNAGRSVRTMAWVLGLMLISLAVWGNFGSPLGWVDEDKTEGPSTPSVLLVIDAVDSAGDLTTPQEILEITKQTANIQLANSFVSDPIGRFALRNAADYNLSIAFGPAPRKQQIAFISLSTRKGAVLYSDTIAYSPTNPTNYAAELEASLVYITSPNGSIAKNERPSKGEESSSGYACFLSIESRRAKGADALGLLDECIKKYPESDYRAFWYARRSFLGFQGLVQKQIPIVKKGKPWEDLQLAFEADRFNAFANFVGAKVELAVGNCPAALQYVDTALEKGRSYPTLIAGMEAHAASCINTNPDTAIISAHMAALVEYNPDPDPLLNMYMLIAALASDDMLTAQQIARRNLIENPETPAEVTLYLLQQSINDNNFAVENRQRLTNSLNLFIWNKDVNNALIKTLMQGGKT